MKSIREKLKSSKVYLYGAGNIGISLYQSIKGQINIYAFLDSKAKTIAIEGMDVLNPFEESINTHNTFVIVSIFNRAFNFDSIKIQLNQVGFDEVISYIEFYPFLKKKNTDWFWLSNNLEYLNKKSEIELVSKLFEDNKSRKIFASTIMARRNFSYSMLPSPDPIHDQYFSKDIPLNEFDNFVDCGAYNGDTLDILIDQQIGFKKIYAFEPDLNNFTELTGKIKKYDLSAILYPCGVYSSNILLNFGGGANEGSTIHEGGSTHIQCVALDDILINELSKSTYLKMDIEGSELEALKGGANLIKKLNPDLAICLYHKPDDILTIPLFIQSLGSYTFYLRQYGYYGMELVLYAIKKSM